MVFPHRHMVDILAWNTTFDITPLDWNEGADLLERLLYYNASNRLSCKNALEHKYFLTDNFK